jgi:hypothetical protein
LRRNSFLWMADTSCCRMLKPMRMPILRGGAGWRWAAAGA